MSAAPRGLEPAVAGAPLALIMSCPLAHPVLVPTEGAGLGVRCVAMRTRAGERSSVRWHSGWERRWGGGPGDGHAEL